MSMEDSVTVAQNQRIGIRYRNGSSVIDGFQLKKMDRTRSVSHRARLLAIRFK